MIAVTGDDEDNMLVCQVAKEKYLCDRIIARVNNPRNHDHFRLLGIQPAVSATDLILRLIEHEVPRYGLVHLLALEEERLEIIELEVADDAPTVGQSVAEIDLPEGSLIISVLRGGTGFVPKADTVIEAGDEVLLVLDPGSRRRSPLTSRPMGTYPRAEPYYPWGLRSRPRPAGPAIRDGVIGNTPASGAGIWGSSPCPGVVDGPGNAGPFAFLEQLGTGFGPVGWVVSVSAVSSCQPPRRGDRE